MRSAQPKPLSCPQCQGTTFTRKTTTYPMRMLDGRQVNGIRPGKAILSVGF